MGQARGCRSTQGKRAHSWQWPGHSLPFARVFLLSTAHGFEQHDRDVFDERDSLCARVGTRSCARIRAC